MTNHLLVLTALLVSGPLSAATPNDRYDLGMRAAATYLSREAEIVSGQKTPHRTQVLSHGQPTDRAVLVIHGLHSSPYFMTGISQRLFNAGANVVSLRLPGHFEDDQDRIAHVQSEEWLEATRLAFEVTRRLGNKVSVLGYSTGGTLAANLALLYPKKIASIALIAPALSVSNRVFLSSTALGWSGLTTHSFCGPTFEDGSRLCKVLKMIDEQILDTSSHRMTSAPGAGFEVQELIESIVRRYRDPMYDSFPEMESQVSYFKKVEDAFANIRVPTILVDSEIDSVVRPELNLRVLKRIRARKDTLLFKKQQEIRHTVMASTKEQAYPHDPVNGYNKQFDPMMDRIVSFIWR